MNLSLDSIFALEAEKGLDRNFYKKLLEHKSSYQNMRYRDNVGRPWGFWDQISEILERNKPELQDFHVDNKTNVDYVLNLANFIPTEFCKNLDIFIPEVLDLSYRDSCSVLHVKSIFSCISKYIDDSESRVECSTGFFVSFIFCCIANKVDFDKYKNILGCKNGMEDEKDDVRRIITSNSRPVISGSFFEKPKIALFVTGQVRSELAIADGLKKAFEGYEVDLFFSSWRKKGGTAIKKSQIHRYFTSESLIYMKKNGYLIDDDFITFFDIDRANNITDLDYAEVEGCFDFCNECYINIIDESLTSFSKLNNAEKMYYHNSTWIKNLGRNFFNKYDIIFKVRPDIEFTSLDVKSIIKDISGDNYITEDHGGWIYRNWGLGVGDQVLVGKPSVLIPILDIFDFDDVDISCQIQKNDLKLQSYVGHVNIAIKSVINGFYPLPNSYFTIIFSDYKKIGLDKVLKYLEVK